MSIKMRMPPLASVRGQTLLTDNKPYLYRQSPVVAEMLEDMIVGGTVAWNQILRRDATYTSNGVTTTLSGGIYTLSNNSTNTYCGTDVLNGGVRLNHVYIGIIRTIANPNTVTLNYVTLGSSANNPAFNINNVGGVGIYSRIFKSSKEITANIPVGFNGLTNGTNMSGIKFSANYIDLTLMFGSTIADYVYSLEQQTAGSGIAFLQSYGFFVEDYYPYDAGSLLSVKTSGHKTVGKNLFSGDTISLAKPSTRTKSVLIETILAGTYVLSWEYSGTSTNTRVVFRKAQGVTEDQQEVVLTQSSPKTVTFTVDMSAAYYFIATTQADGVTAEISKMMIRKVGTSDSYEPYEEHTYPLSDIELRGVPKLTDGNIVYDGDTYASDGTVTRKYGIVTLTGSTGAWTKSSSYSGGYYLPGWVYGYSKPNSVDHVQDRFGTARDLSEYSSMTNVVYFDNSLSVKVDNSLYPTVADFKALLNANPITMVYPLATETTESADAFENPQVSGTTEEYVDERTVPMPVGHVTEYFNMEQMEKIQMHMATHSPIKMHMPTV